MSKNIDIEILEYEYPLYSKKRIQKAGKALRKNENDNDDLEVFNNWRSSHAMPLDIISGELSSAVNDIDNENLIVKRLKRAPSIINKLKLQPTMSLASMQDIGGCRTIVSNIDNVYKISDKIKHKLLSHSLVCTTDYIQNPKSSGYRSMHHVYKFNGEGISDKHSGLLIEIQIRTINQHYWATAVETMGTYLKQSLKSSQGDREYLDLFSKVGDLIAFYENSSLYHKGSILRLLKETRVKIQLLKIFDKLIAFREVTSIIESEFKDEESPDYYLVITDSDKKTIRVQSVTKENLRSANVTYTKLEQRFQNSASKDVVLVSAKNLDELREAYPNYFNDINNFFDLFNTVSDYIFNNVTDDEKISYESEQKKLSKHLLKKRLRTVRSRHRFAHRSLRMLMREYKKTKDINKKKKLNKIIKKIARV